MEKIEIDKILGLLPHRYPFLLVDRIIEINPGVSVKGIKNVTFNEPFFQGHFPGNPIFSGMLIIEAMAQTGIILAKFSDTSLMEKLIVFAGIEDARFRKKVIPGDQVIMELKFLKKRGHIWKMDGKAYVDGDVVAESVLIAAVT
jgi:beta-hydroxyacyl-ACP dehydratase FabZ